MSLMDVLTLLALGFCPGLGLGILIGFLLSAKYAAKVAAGIIKERTGGK